jgi:hypothetical protein
MPSKTKKQSKFMAAIANNPKFAKKVGISRAVGKDFSAADKKAKKFRGGGSADYPVRIELKKKPENRPARPVTQRDLDRHSRMQGEEAVSEGKIMRKAKGGSIDGVAKKGKTKTKMVKMAAGGAVPARAGMTGLARAASASGRTFKKGGKPKKMNMGGMSDMAGRALPASAGADAMGRAMLSRPATAGRPAMTGLDRAAAMSGRTMPTTGRPMRKGGKAKGRK